MSGETSYIPLNMQVLKGASLREVYCCPHPQLESLIRGFTWGSGEGKKQVLKQITLSPQGTDFIFNGAGDIQT